MTNKYKIGNTEFKTITEISQYSKTLYPTWTKNLNLNGDESSFLWALIRLHPSKTFNKGIKFVRPNTKKGTIEVEYVDGDIRPLSLQACIKNIPVIKTEFTFGFGKYVGLTIQEVYDLDERYLKWLISDKVDIYPEVQKKITEFLTSLQMPNSLNLEEKLKNAIASEDYETAAKLRDRILIWETLKNKTNGNTN